MVDPNVRPSVIADADTYRSRLRRGARRAATWSRSPRRTSPGSSPQRSAADAARMLLQAGPRVVLLTRGADGVQVVTGAGDVPVPAPEVEVVDTIGAGDAFGGGFLAWWRAQGLGREQLDDQAARRRGRQLRRPRRGTHRRARRRLAAVPARGRPRGRRLTCAQRQRSPPRCSSSSASRRPPRQTRRRRPGRRPRGPRSSSARSPSAPSAARDARLRAAPLRHRRLPPARPEGHRRALHGDRHLPVRLRHLRQRRARRRAPRAARARARTSSSTRTAPSTSSSR